MDLNTLPWRKSSYSEDNGGNCVELAPLWRKSSHSEDNGGQCVELAPLWRKSSHSEDNGGACVELAGRRASVAVRDSKNPEDGALMLTRQAFGSLVGALRT
jgi:hypothetical protein